MKVLFHYFGQLREITTINNEEFYLTEEETLINTLLKLADSYDKSFRHIMFDESGNLRPSMIILVNGSTIKTNKPPELHDGDEIALLTPIAGG